MTTKEILSCICMDLKRVALGYHRGSDTMAKRFAQEALKRIEQIDSSTLEPYMKAVLQQTKDLLTQTNTVKMSEDSLMYSTLLQNYCQKYSI